MKLVDKIYINRGQFGYYTTIKNGEDKMFITVGFKNGQEPADGTTQITILDGFLTFYKNKQGLPQTKIMILDYNSNRDEEIEREGIEQENNFNITSGDGLPF